MIEWFFIFIQLVCIAFYIIILHPNNKKELRNQIKLNAIYAKLLLKWAKHDYELHCKFCGELSDSDKKDFDDVWNSQKEKLNL